MKKVLCLLLIILLLSSLFLIYLEKGSNATYSTKFANYPGYKELLDDLQRDHPNWEFEIFETGLDWSTVLANESTVRHGRSLIPWNDGIWNCPTCKNYQYETGWYCASTEAVAYYLDPRNSLCEDYIFQFEQLTYDKNIQTKEGVEKILSVCNYMQGKITYFDAAGNKQNIDKTYIDVIMEAAETYNVSPYHLASRIRQEIGTGDGSAMASGTWHEKDENGVSYEGYYNYYNWGAFGANIMLNGLKTAKKYGWTDPEKAIKGGASLISQGYISIGQDTLYLQKFDVVDGGDGYYGHQYMTNVTASKEEGSTVKGAYIDMGLLTKDSKIKFKIPVYKNMPTSKAGIPGKETIVTQDIQLNAVTNVIKEKKENGGVIAKLQKDTKLLRIELADSKGPGKYYWDKVVLSDGTIGYAVRNNLTQIPLQSNCNEKYVVIKELALRNGPGTTNTDVIKYILPGQMITAVEKEKYPNLDGESWYRIKLTDGNYGYVSIGDAKDPNMVLYDENSEQYDYVKVICTIDLMVRKSPTTKENNIITSVSQGAKLFRIQKNASNNEGYVWDKIITSSGEVGYIVRQDKSGEIWVESIKDTSIVGTGFKTSGNNLTCQPDIKVADIKKVAKDAVIKKGDTTIADSANVGTGYTITYGGKTFIVFVLGDVNGDGKVNTGDTLAMSQHIEKYKSIKDANYLKAADVNGDGKVNTGDSLVLRQHVENFKKIIYK